LALKPSDFCNIGVKRAEGEHRLLKPSDNYGWRGCWLGDEKDLATGPDALASAAAHTNRPLFAVDYRGETAVAHTGEIVCGNLTSPEKGLPLLALAPPLDPSDLGDAAFKSELGLKYAYIVGAMANGITSTQMVRAAGNAGLIGFFGSGGLSLSKVREAISDLKQDGADLPMGFNLIHSPNDAQLEMALADLYIENGIRVVSASAYMGMTLPLVYYRVKGIHRTPDGSVRCPNRVIAKVSRVEVATHFFSPPPQKLLTQLIRMKKITEAEAQLATVIPMAQELTAEADSGGHTDNRPALSLLPTLMALRDRCMKQYGYATALRIGLAGGIATPQSVAAAFAMGAAYVLTGSINQAAVEADTSESVRQLLEQTRQADVIMAPAADMFELGAKVQVLKRGTMFAMRAAKLYELYRTYDRYEAIPGTVRAMVEQDILRSGFEEAWHQTADYFRAHDPSQIERADGDPKHKMALVFRSYLGQASLWAKHGDMDRQIDYQIWCGPAMGAFNAWAKDSCLEKVDDRYVADMAINLLYGAAGLTRCQWLHDQGVTFEATGDLFRPQPAETIAGYLR
jgi:PfaD family protein